MSQVQDIPEVMRSRLNPPKLRGRWWPRWGIWVVVSVLVFVCGGVAGYGVAVQSFESRFKNRESWGRPPGGMMKAWNERLHLSEEQSAKMEAILKEHFRRIGDIRKSIAPAIDKENDAIQAEVSAILNDSQRPVWEERFEKIRKMFSGGPQHRGPWHRGGGAPGWREGGEERHLGEPGRHSGEPGRSERGQKDQTGSDNGPDRQHDHDKGPITAHPESVAPSDKP